jgi:predicted outer membrane protein
MKAATIAFPAAPIPAGPTVSRGAPNEARIAHIVIIANQIDIGAGELAETTQSSSDVKAFGKQMIIDHTGANKQAADLVKKLGVELEDNPTSRRLEQRDEANIRFAKLATAVAVTACVGIALAQQVQAREAIRVSAYGIAEKQSNAVTTPAEPRRFGRDSVYATRPPNPGNPVLAGGLTVDEGGGAPVYAVQLTHPSGPVMEAGNDFQPYGRDSVYMAGSPNAVPSHLAGRKSSPDPDSRPRLGKK